MQFLSLRHRLLHGEMSLATRTPREKSGEMVVICKLINKPQNILLGARPFWKTCNITLHTREGCDCFLQFYTCLVIPWFNINEETGFGDDCFFCSKKDIEKTTKKQLNIYTSLLYRWNFPPIAQVPNGHFEFTHLGSRAIVICKL